MSCENCRVIITIGDPEIEYCPLHEAAPAMLEALKAVGYPSLSFFRGYVGEGQISYADIKKVRAAIAVAEAKP